MVHAEALEWLAAQKEDGGFPEKSCVVTSLPDWSELKKGQKMPLTQYLQWFQKALSLIFSCCRENTLVIFLQTDIMSGGQWIDKAALICKEAEAAKATLLWHKITFDPEVVNLPRCGLSADYSHLLCFITSTEPGRSVYRRCDVPDLMCRGRKVYAQGMGIEAMARVLQWVQLSTEVRLVIDPFCGRGTVLALANDLGLPALGVDVDVACARAAERLDLEKLSRSETVQPVTFYLKRAAEGRGKTRSEKSRI